MYMIVAWRIARLIRLGRTCPDLEALLFFHADEIRGTQLLAKKARPASPPTLRIVYEIISRTYRVGYAEMV